ncbi:MAG: phosphomethylpyrimidine synthase ThiC [Dehalococcoidia bacterium]|nr:phosphomethylpyrimidine synthase ThiC [Dehalococcoidia bacterium]
MTQLEGARRGEISPALRSVAQEEGLDVEELRSRVAEGLVVIPANIRHLNLVPSGIGKGLRTKVNANLGTSTDYPYPDQELEKLSVSLEAGADTVMDLSTGGDISAIRRSILERCIVPLGTVPIYQAAIESIEQKGAIVNLSSDDLFRAIEEQARDGVDFMTVHCGVTRASLERLQRQGRVVDIVSRGGAFLTGWILHNQKENPLYEEYDRLLEIALRYDVTLSLGDGLRPGCLADATDRAQIEELLTLGELVDRARDAGVQVMVEGPGHVPLDQIVTNIQLQKRLCREAPFYVLGPLVTDIAAGHDHITAAIGGALAAMSGADYLCYVTPAEHLGLPELEDVREGIMAARIAGHAADIVKGVKGAWQRDLDMSKARKALDWDAQKRLALDPRRVEEVRSRRGSTGDACSMCGKYCAMDLVSQHLGVHTVRCAS